MNPPKKDSEGTVHARNANVHVHLNLSSQWTLNFLNGILKKIDTGKNITTS